MWLETIGILFLVTRIDVSQPRRVTSEPNEHTIGAWRSVMNEFNIMQLIQLVDKTKIRMEAIFNGDISRNVDKKYTTKYKYI